MDYELLARQLIRALRGKRSQVALSRRLSFDSNVLYTWESGRRSPTAATFFTLAARAGVDVPGAIGKFVGGLPEPLVGLNWSEPSSAAALLSHLREGTTVVELARRVGKNRVSVARWLSGEAEPRLPEFLHLLEACTLRVLDFISQLVSPSLLPAARSAWQVLEAQRRVAYGLPWSHAVLRALELDEYRRLPCHETGWIATRLGISPEEEEQCLQALAQSGLIEWQRRHWRSSAVLTVDTRQSPEAGRMLKAHWAEVGLARLPKLEARGEDLFSYNLFTVSNKDWEKLRELHIAYYQELRRVIEASEPAERVGLINLQLLRLDA